MRQSLARFLVAGADPIDVARRQLTPPPGFGDDDQDEDAAGGIAIQDAVLTDAAQWFYAFAQAAGDDARSALGLVLRALYVNAPLEGYAAWRRETGRRTATGLADYLDGADATYGVDSRWVSDALPYVDMRDDAARLMTLAQHRRLRALRDAIVAPLLSSAVPLVAGAA